MGNLTGKRTGTARQVGTSEHVRRTPGKSTLVETTYGAGADESSSLVPVQRKTRDGAVEGGAAGDHDVHAVADGGLAGASGPLPFAPTIQTLFGAHDVSDVRASTDAAATAANASLGAIAYAKGNRIAFAGTPDLHTAAHEAAHVVQQRRRLQLKRGIGEAGDFYERHADAVADKVVRGESAESLLSSVTSPAAGPSVPAAVQHQAVQFLGSALGEALPAGTDKPAFGEDSGQQRKYSLEQYIAMWEKEQGRKMRAYERATLEQGCIGITLNNLDARERDPLAIAEGTYGTFEQAHAEMVQRNAFLDLVRKNPRRGSLLDFLLPRGRYVLFAQLFWSNQSEYHEARKQPDPDAFRPDPGTGKIDMAGYKYHPRSVEDKELASYVNFDFGFWDEASQCFWHANHMRYKDPGKDAERPMVVYQSTKERFASGYKEFDRIVYCIARAVNYDPRLAAISRRKAR